MFTYEQLKKICQKIKDFSYIRKELEKNFHGIYLDENTHTYTYQGQKFNSTSNYIKKFEKQSFNAHNVAFGTTKGQNRDVFKHKMVLRDLLNDFLLTKQEVLVRYKLISEQAITMGNRVHMYAEMYPFFINPHCEQEEAILSWFKRYVNDRSKYVLVAKELKIYDKEYMKAGTIDLLLYNIKTNKLCIVDFKSNKKSLLMSYGNSKLAAPFEDLSDCPYSKYSLQLSDYKNILEKNTNYEVEDMFILHLFPEKLNYVSKYKNKTRYNMSDKYSIKTKTRKYTIFNALDLSERLKKTYK